MSKSLNRLLIPFVPAESRYPARRVGKGVCTAFHLRENLSCAVPTVLRENAWARRTIGSSKFQGSARAFAHPHMGPLESSIPTGLGCYFLYSSTVVARGAMRSAA